jgi:hypothetical protein
VSPSMMLFSLLILWSKFCLCCFPRQWYRNVL